MNETTPTLSLIEHFSELKDPRRDLNKDHLLIDILVIAILAVICGANDFVGMAEYGSDKEAWLRTFLALPEGIPSHDTFGRVFARIKPREFQRCFLNWVGGVAQATASEVVAIDGKTMQFATLNAGTNGIPAVSGSFLFGNQINLTGSVLSPNRTYPLLGVITSIESDTNSIYHSLQAEASLRMRQVQLTSADTRSHAIDEVSDLFDLAGARGLPQNSFNCQAERASANFDVRHRLAQGFIWDLPFFETNKLLGGWQLAGIVTLQTEQPFTVNSSIDVNLDGNLTDRPNTLTGVLKVNEGARAIYIVVTGGLSQQVQGERADFKPNGARGSWSQSRKTRCD